MAYEDRYEADMNDVGADYPNAEDVHGYLQLVYRLIPGVALLGVVAVIAIICVAVSDANR